MVRPLPVVLRNRPPAFKILEFRLVKSESHPIGAQEVRQESARKPQSCPNSSSRGEGGMDRGTNLSLAWKISPPEQIM